MDPEMVERWIEECQNSDTSECPTSPKRRRAPAPDASNKAKRPRLLPLANVDPNFDRSMSTSRDSNRGPEKESSQMAARDDPDREPTPRPRKRASPFPAPALARRGLNDSQSAVSDSQDRGSGVSSRTRSSSPIKNPDDLLKLKKPVSWTTPEPRALRDAVQATGSGQALRLFDDVWKIVQKEGYLPQELKGILKDELMVGDSHFATNSRNIFISEKNKHDASRLSLGNEVASIAVYSELCTIRDIATTTVLFVNSTRSEATWNDHIHGPILRLAVSSTPDIAAENITQASICRAFVPASRGEIEILNGKMIDYALLLRPEKSLSVRIAEFVDGFDGPRTFNQSTNGPLCYEPTGVFVETKVESRRRAEGKAQLGVWLAAWYGRVAKFAPVPPTAAGTVVNLPFVPVLLVVCERWELYFAFDKDDEYEVCGPLEIGSTVTVDGSYRVLGVLRLLARWVAGEFRNWVERCVALR